MTDATDAASSGLAVALVHGAFADSSSWNNVVEQLQAAGVAVQAVSNPLRGITADAAYVASVIRQIPDGCSPSVTPTAVRPSQTPHPTPETSSAWSMSPPSPPMRVETLGAIEGDSRGQRPE